MEWVAIPFSKESSWPRNQTQFCCIVNRFFTTWATRFLHTDHLSLRRWTYSSGQGRSSTLPFWSLPSGRETNHKQHYKRYLAMLGKWDGKGEQGEKQGAGGRVEVKKRIVMCFQVFVWVCVCPASRRPPSGPQPKCPPHIHVPYLAPPSQAALPTASWAPQIGESPSMSHPAHSLNATQTRRPCLPHISVSLGPFLNPPSTASGLPLVV